MKTARKVVIGLAWTGIAIPLLISVTLALGPLEFQDPSYEIGVLTWWIFGVPSCVSALILFGIRTGDSGSTIARRIAIALLVPFILLVFIGTVGFANAMCTWTEWKTVFVHKNDPGRRIVVRGLGCGALDSGPPAMRTVEIVALSNWLNHIQEVDTTLIDRSRWNRVGGTR